MRKIIIPIPTGTSAEDKAARSHMMGSGWSVVDPAVPTGILLPNKVYALQDATAAGLVRKGVAKYVDANGKVTDETAPPLTDIRPGTKEWKALPPEQRVGSEEWREAELQKRLDAAAIEEAKATQPFVVGTISNGSGIMAADDSTAIEDPSAPKPKK